MSKDRILATRNERASHSDVCMNFHGRRFHYSNESLQRKVDTTEFSSPPVPKLNSEAYLQVHGQTANEN